MAQPLSFILSAAGHLTLYRIIYTPFGNAFIQSSLSSISIAKHVQ